MSRKCFYISNIGLLALGIAGCNSGGSTTASAPTNNIPAAFQCLPSQLPSVSSSTMSNKMAYAANCEVANAAESRTLLSMSAAMEAYNLGHGFNSYCSSIPLEYNPSTGVGFILTAAHCVTGGTKAAGAYITSANIESGIYNTTRINADNHNAAWIMQNTTSGAYLESGSLTAQVVAVYVPRQYCRVPDFDSNGTCSNITFGNGDFAVLKVKTLEDKTLLVLPTESLALAPANLALASHSYILGLGYGSTNPNGTVDGQNIHNTQLNYLNYQFFGTNSYAGVSGEVVNMNGYSTNGGYYSIVCGGDSGGGDFVWNGTGWYLVGVHSYITYQRGTEVSCGASNSAYYLAANASADVRQFHDWIQTVLNEDTESSGCASLPSSEYVCKSGGGI